MITRFITSAATAAILVAASVSAGHAAASDLDNCILDITFQCVDDDDFWGCYDTGVELCENQSSAEIATLSKGKLRTIKKDAHQRAQAVLQKQIDTKRP